MKSLSDTTTLALLAFCLLWGIVIGMMIGNGMYKNSPSIVCVQEDSCYADYWNGQWYIFPTEQEVK